MGGRAGARASPAYQGLGVSDAAPAEGSVGSQITQTPLQAIPTPDSQIPSPRS